MPRLRGIVRASLIKLLFKLVDVAEGADSGGKVEQWLAEAWQHPGFRSYIAQRDFMIVRQLAGGDQLAAPEHRKVWQMTGQRVELLKLGQRAKAAHESLKKKNINKK